jgi:hypothetical protein
MTTLKPVLTTQSIFWVNDDKVPLLKTGEFEFYKKDILDKTYHLQLLKMPIFNSMFHKANKVDVFKNVSSNNNTRAKILYKNTHIDKHPLFPRSIFNKDLFLGMYKRETIDKILIELANSNFCFNNENIKKTRLIVDNSKNKMYFSDGIDLHIHLKLIWTDPNNESLWISENNNSTILDHMGTEIPAPCINLLIQKNEKGIFNIYIIWYTPTHNITSTDKPKIKWENNSIRTTGTSGNIEPSYFKGIDDVSIDPFATNISINYNNYNLEALIPSTKTLLVLPETGGDHHPNNDWAGECEYRKLQNIYCDHAQICSSLHLNSILYKMPYPEPSRYDKKQNENILDIRTKLGMKKWAEEQLEKRVKIIEKHNEKDIIIEEDIDKAEYNISLIQEKLREIDINARKILDLQNRLLNVEKETILKDIEPPIPEDTIEYKVNKLKIKLDTLIKDVSKNTIKLKDNNKLIKIHENDILFIKDEITTLSNTKVDKEVNRTIIPRSLEEKIDLLLNKLN